MSSRAPDGGGMSCLGCGGCLALFVVVASLVFFAIAGSHRLPQAIAVAVVIAFLVGILALERDRRR